MRNQYSSSYKTDERVLKQLINNNMQPTDPQDKIRFIIYYRQNNISQLISKNNQGPVQPILKHTNIVYQYTCPLEDSALQKQQYIGHSITTLSRRLTMHLNNGGPLQHATTVHNQNLTRENLVNNTIIIHHENNF